MNWKVDNVENFSIRTRFLSGLLAILMLWGVFPVSRSTAKQADLPYRVNREEAIVGNHLILALEEAGPGPLVYQLNGQEEQLPVEAEVDEDSGLVLVEFPLTQPGDYDFISLAGKNLSFHLRVYESMNEAYGQASKLLVDLPASNKVTPQGFQELLTHIRAYDQKGDFDEVQIELVGLASFTYYNDGITSTISSEEALEFYPGRFPMLIRYGQEELVRQVEFVEDQVSLAGEEDARLQAVDSVVRLSGKSRQATAAAIARQGFSKADTVFLVSGENFADALTAGSLAYARSAPLLFAGPTSLSQETKASMEKLGAKNVIIIGGQEGISKGIETSLQKQGLVVQRLAGKNRYATAIEVAKSLREQSHKDTLVLVSGRIFPDALSIAPYAARENYPVLYSDGSLLDADTMKYIRTGGFKKALLVGGQESVSSKVVDQIKKIGLEVERLAGASRYETSALVASKFFPGSQAATLANGLNYPDALAGGVFAAKKNAPVLLTASNQLSKEALRYLEAEKVEDIYLFGGQKSLSNKIQDQLVSIQRQKLAGKKENKQEEQAPAPVKPSGDRVLRVQPRGRGAEDWKGKDDSRAYAQLNKPIRILLDPGHGPGAKHNRGFIGGNEGDNNFYLAQDLKTALEKRGFEVALTRKKITDDPTLEQRGVMGAGFDLLISVHSNAISGEEARKRVQGTEVFDDVCWSNKDLATALVGATAKTFGHPNRGVKYRYTNPDKDTDKKQQNWYGVLRHSRATFAMLVENGFHTHPEDAAKLRDGEFRRKLADVQAQIIADYFKGLSFE